MKAVNGGSALTLSVHERAAAHAAAFPDRVAAGGGFQVGKTGSGNDALYGVVMGGQNYRNKSKMYGALPPSFNPTVFSLFPDARRVLHLFSGSQTAEQVEDEYARVTHVRFDNGLHPAARDAKPDVIGDAENLEDAIGNALWVPRKQKHPPSCRLCKSLAHVDDDCEATHFDLIIADPPYALADQRRYFRESGLADCKRCGKSKDAHHVLPMAGGLFRYCNESGPQRYAPKQRFVPLNKKAVIAECAKVLAPGGWLAWLDVILPHFATEKAGGPWIFRGGFSLVRSTGHRVRWTTFLERRA